MEDVLEVYHRSYEDSGVPARPASNWLGRPGNPVRRAAYDYEYQRNGVSNVHAFAPLDDGWK